jgi:uncharacterized protein (TIGR03083 family)
VPLTAFTAEAGRLAEVALGLTPQQWRRPTSCPPWDVAGLLGHVLTAVSRVPAMVAGIARDAIAALLER